MIDCVQWRLWWSDRRNYMLRILSFVGSGVPTKLSSILRLVFTLFPLLDFQFFLNSLLLNLTQLTSQEYRILILILTIA